MASPKSASTRSRKQAKRSRMQSTERHQVAERVQEHLSTFGYLTEETWRPGVIDAATKRALRTFQRRNSLHQTGRLDKATLELTSRPRCGVPDVDLPGQRAGERYSLSGCSYQGKRRILTYAFKNGTPDIPGDGDWSAVRRAFATWQAQIPIDFAEVGSANGADLTLGWYRGEHGDGNRFDGIGGILAHAFFPPPCGGEHAGECHFDESESWNLTHTSSTFDLETVALHEIGHLLGLRHSSDPTSVMYPYYGGIRRNLGPDDTSGVQRLYGRRGPTLHILVHLQDEGDRYYRENEFAGTRGKWRRLEGFHIELSPPVPGLGLRYMAHLQGKGDLKWVPEGTFIGTRGQGRRLEGFAIQLTGALAQDYTVIYMAHCQGTGDTSIRADGKYCGTRGQSRRVEGILVRIEPKS